MRTTQEKGNYRSPPGCIVALVEVHEALIPDENPILCQHRKAPNEQQKWFNLGYACQHPITVWWKLEYPIACDLPRGTRTNFNARSDLLARLPDIDPIPPVIRVTSTNDVAGRLRSIFNVDPDSKEPLPYHFVLDDSLHVPNFFAPPPMAHIEAEFDYIPEGAVQTRNQRPLSDTRRKGYMVLEDPIKGVPFYGGYVGSSAGHATYRPFDEERKVTWALFQQACKLVPELNHLIVTRYDDNTKYMPAHSDKVKDLACTPILDFSIGATRRLVFTPIDRPGYIAASVNLTNGSLFVLGPQTNHKYMHQVPVESTRCGPRMCLIFRAATSYKTPSQIAAARLGLGDALRGTDAAFEDTDD